MPEITYKTGFIPETKSIIDLYASSGLIRPIQDIERIKSMYENSNLVISAWDNEQLVGIARSLTDFCYACYLSDLAVHKTYQKEGIGRTLIELTKDKISEQTALILLSAPGAMEYYPKVGFDVIENGFIIKRKS
ncbi:GNAT family N-acetyltransferase [bacterium]|nr:MAG: GNAT family N-acetyltransferase [bacterium]